MSEIVIPPSPNWFLSNCLCVGSDGFVVYGTLANGIAILTPSEDNCTFIDAKIIKPAHKEKVTCIALSPDWIDSRLFVSGSDDGFVKIWNTKKSSLHIASQAHEVHSMNKESVLGAVFLDSGSVVSLGSSGSLVIWATKSNSVETDSRTLKFCKPVCLANCPFKPKTVAVGTKKGVIFILSILDTVKIIFKIPGHDSEITSLSWCPSVSCEYFDNKSTIAKDIKNDKILITQNPSTPLDDNNLVNNTPDKVNDHDSKNLSVNEGEAAEAEDVLPEMNGALKKFEKKTEEKSIFPNEGFDYLKECQELKSIIEGGKKNKTSNSLENGSSNEEMNKQKSYEDYGNDTIEPEEIYDSTNLRARCFDDSDIFDIYTDNTNDEFGHTNKYVSANKPEEKQEVAHEPSEKILNLTNSLSSIRLDDSKINVLPNADVKEFIYLASSCKKGKVNIWRWGGGLVFSETINTPNKNKFKKKPAYPFGVVHWLSENVILAASKESQLVCRSLKKDHTKELHHEHKRGLYCITSRVSTSDNINVDPIIWSASMDRLLVGYSMNNNKTTLYSTYGNYIYDIQPSPIEQKMFAVGCADGMIRIWKLNKHGNSFEAPSSTKQFWNSVHGNVMSVAWHPEEEFRLAFSTYEGRVGVLWNTEKESPAMILPLPFSLGVYHVCWGSNHRLFACRGGSLVVFLVKKDIKATELREIPVNVCNAPWEISTMTWNKEYLSVGSQQGGFALLNHSDPYEVIAAAYPHRKYIKNIAWHPSEIAGNSDTSFSDLIAVSANAPNIVILKLNRTNGEVKLDTINEYTIHSGNVTGISWSPHNIGHLLSTSHDCTAQIYDVLNDCLLHTFTGHVDGVLCSAWYQDSPNYVITGGKDCTVRVWDISKYPPLKEPNNMRKKNNKKTKWVKLGSNDETSTELASTINNSTVKPDHNLGTETNFATVKSAAKKLDKKKYPLTQFWEQYKEATSVNGCNFLFKKIVAKNENNDQYEIDYSNGYDYLKVFEDRDKVMDFLNMEQNYHKEKCNWDAFTIIGILKGDIKGVIENAWENNVLTPQLLSIAPSVSIRFWKEMLENYCQQQENSPKEHKDPEMGQLSVIWHGLMLLSVGKIEEGCLALSKNGLHAEAISAARARHAEHLAEKHLKIWIERLMHSGLFLKASECYLSLGNIMEAASALGRSNEETELALAAEMAKYIGNPILADSILKHA